MSQEETEAVLASLPNDQVLLENAVEAPNPYSAGEAKGLDSSWVVLTVTKGTLPNSTVFLTEDAAREWAKERTLNRSGERVFLAQVVYECAKTGVEWKKL